MNIVVNNALVIPAHVSRKNIAYSLLDMNTGKYGFMPLADTTKQDKEELENYKATLLFVHSKFDVVGVVKDSKKGTSPCLYWLLKSEAEKIKDCILNYNERFNIIDISDKPIEIFRGNFNKKIFGLARIYDSSMRYPISYDDFVKQITVKDKPTPVIQGGQSNIQIQPEPKKEETVAEKKEEHIDNKAEVVAEKSEAVAKEEVTKAEQTKEEKTVETVEKPLNEVQEKQEKKVTKNKQNEVPRSNDEKLMMTMLTASKVMSNTIKELKQTVQSYKEALAKTTGELDIEDEVKLVGVSDIKGINGIDSEPIENNETHLDSFYSFILQVMKIDDTITVPRTYYEKLIVIIKRNMMLSRDGNTYDSIVTIKFSKEAKENIVARVEYSASKEDTRITIIKPYNSVELTNQQLIDYEIKFNQWKRLHSFRTTS